MVWDFFRRKETPRVAEPLWAEALGGAGGPSAPVLMFVLDSRYIPALDIALRQRSLAPVEGPQLRWAGPMRSAMAVPLRRGGYDLVALVGHRMEDLAQGLRLEAGLPLEPGEAHAGDAAPEGVSQAERSWYVGLPSNWRDQIANDERQLHEARAFLESRFPERRVAGASTLARLEPFDRARWVEHGVVAWEESSGRADLAFAGLLMHEHSWLHAADDPLAPKVHALLWHLGEQDQTVSPLARKIGLRPSVASIGGQRLSQEVPAEVAAAAAGLPPDRREGYAGEARYLLALEQIQDVPTRADLRVEAAEAMLARYGSGWNPARLHEIIETWLNPALQSYGNKRTGSRAQALLLLGRAWGGLGDAAKRRQALEDAARVAVDERGRPVDADLARAILAELER